MKVTLSSAYGELPEGQKFKFFKDNMKHQIISDVAVFGELDPKAFNQIKRCSEKAVASALMGDHHVGYSQPIGGVVAYKGMISPSGVGYDIACGNKAVRTDAKLSDIRENIKPLMDAIWKSIAFGSGEVNRSRVDFEAYPLFREDPAWKIPIVKSLHQTAKAQFGTVGSGNHYVDIFHDEQDRVWIGVHFGSRKFGHSVATHYLKEAGGRDGMDVPPTLIEEESRLGQEYIAAMNLAGRYAYAARDWVCSRVAQILQCRIVEEIHNHHNFAWKEKHQGEDLWVIRKGATPAGPGVKGFVGGSMGEISVILEGVESEASRVSLYSTIHGAGRVLSRTAARGKMKWIRGEDGKKKPTLVSAGCVTQEMMDEWVTKAGVELRGAGIDESPQCYKRLPEVLEHHSESVRVLHTLTPIGVAMAGGGDAED